MKNSKKNISSVEELENQIAVEQLEDRLEMVQLAVLSTDLDAEAASKRDCICGNELKVDLV